ncbi:hypothetical protein ABZ641_39355, partial [Kitasatospora sp. NPDC007106]
MAEAGIDYAAAFQALPGAITLLTPQLVFAAANETFLRQAERSRDVGEPGVERLGAAVTPDGWPTWPDDPPNRSDRPRPAPRARLAAAGPVAANSRPPKGGPGITGRGSYTAEGRRAT